MSRSGRDHVVLSIATERAVREWWFLPDQQVMHPMNRLGSSRYGDVYTSPFDETVLENWPTVRENLIEWLGVEEEIE